MKETRIIMGMPVSMEIVAETAQAKNPAIMLEIIGQVFDYFTYVDQKFSTYKTDSEIMKINRGEKRISEASADMSLIFELSEKTKRETDGFFDIKNRQGIYDPSGIVKGWAIKNAADIIKGAGFNNFYVDAGGDIQSSGLNSRSKPWSVGIRSPFNSREIVKILYPRGKGLATSGTYIRGDHIYNPKDQKSSLDEIVSLTVIGPDVYEADRFATAAFAMGREGIAFINSLQDFEGYMIDKNGQATMTRGFERYEIYR